MARVDVSEMGHWLTVIMPQQGSKLKSKSLQGYPSHWRINVCTEKVMQ